MAEGKYRVTRKRIRFSASVNPDPNADATRGARVVEAGEIIEDPDDALLEAFPDRLEKVENPDANGVRPGALDPGEYTIDEFEELLESGDFDDELDELAAAEDDGQDREGIYDAIDGRR